MQHHQRPGNQHQQQQQQQRAGCCCWNQLQHGHLQQHMGAALRSAVTAAMSSLPLIADPHNVVLSACLRLSLLLLLLLLLLCLQLLQPALALQVSCS
jgi:hypothetical protein